MEFRVCSGCRPAGLSEVERIGILLNEGKIQSGKWIKRKKVRATDGRRERRLHTGRNKGALAWRGGKRLARSILDSETLRLVGQQKCTMATIVSTKIS